MSFLIGLVSYVLGFIMDLFFQALSLVGYPRLWLCIVLYAVVTRFLFLPQRISNYRSKLLTPVANYDLYLADPDFFKKTDNKELMVERAAMKKAVYKKYKISNFSGCLVPLIQYPFLIALFYVVRNPQEFIPSLEAAANASANVTTFFGLSLSDSPLTSVQLGGLSWLALLAPVCVVLCNFLKMYPTIKQAVTVSQKIKVWALTGAFAALLGWFSLSLPLAVSIYWVVNEITYKVLDYFIEKRVPRTPFVVNALREFQEKKNANATPPVAPTPAEPVESA